MTDLELWGWQRKAKIGFKYAFSVVKAHKNYREFLEEV